MNDRPLTTAEHALELLNQCATTWNIVTISRVRGSLTPEWVRQALDLVQAKYPVLRSRIVGTLDKPILQKNDHPIPLRIVVRTRLAQWAEVANEELNQKIDSSTALLRAVLVSFTDAPNHHYLITTAHHAACDGEATVWLHRDLWQLIAQLAQGISPSVTEQPALPPVDDFLPNRGERFPLLRAIAFSLRFGVQWLWHQVKSLPIETNIAIPERCCRLIPHQLSAPQTQRLLEQCRRHNVTVQSGLCAALLLSVSRQIPVSPNQAFSVSCDSAIDLRRRLNPPIPREQMFAGASWVRTYHKLQPGLSFWALAAQLEAGLNRAIARGEMWRGVSSSLAITAHIIKAAKAVHTNSFVSNLGALTVPNQYGDLALEHLSFTASNGLFAAVPALYVSSFDGQLQLNFMFSQPALSESTMTQIVEHTLLLLNQQVQGMEEPAPLPNPSVAPA